MMGKMAGNPSLSLSSCLLNQSLSPMSQERKKKVKVEEEAASCEMRRGFWCENEEALCSPKLVLPPFQAETRSKEEKGTTISPGRLGCSCACFLVPSTTTISRFGSKLPSDGATLIGIDVGVILGRGRDRAQCEWPVLSLGFKDKCFQGCCRYPLM